MQRVAPNCFFEIDDVEAEWVFEKDSFDYIHNRDFYLTVRNWPQLIQRCYEYVLAADQYRHEQTPYREGKHKLTQIFFFSLQLDISNQAAGSSSPASGPSPNPTMAPCHRTAPTSRYAKPF